MLRPDLSKTPVDLSTYARKPPQQTREDMAVIAEDIYVANNLPSFDSRHLRMVIKMATPDVDLTQEFSCTNCGHTQEMEVPLTANFFWPDR